MIRRDSLNPSAIGLHRTTMDELKEGGESAMRTLLVFLVVLLFMALGALEVVASRAVPLP